VDIKKCNKWLEISLDNLLFNLHSLVNYVKGRKIIAVIKSNAYGHGLVPIARVLEKEKNILSLAVLDIEEGLTLRNAGIKSPILIFATAGAYISQEEADYIVKYNLIPTVCDIKVAKKLHHASLKFASPNHKVGIHVKLDTGMARLGVPYESAPAFFYRLKDYSNLEVKGIYSHFAAADEDKAYTLLQLRRFCRTVANLRKLSLIPNNTLLHMANSAAALTEKRSWLHAIRPGITLFGLYPSAKSKNTVKLIPVLKFKARILYIRKLPPGSYISYSMTYRTSKLTRVGVIPVGYSDGYHRLLSNRGEVVVQNKVRVPIIGRITMDFFMIDITGIPSVKVGDEVELFGEEINVDEVAANCDTISYELLSNLNSRLLRIYTGGRK
jgi:alanine racemase